MEAGDRTGSTTHHEIKALILSRQPIIAIETLEEDRLQQILKSIAGQLGLHLFEWTVTRGLRRQGENRGFHGTHQPLILLKHISSLTVEGIFFLKDFSELLAELEVRRQFRELGQQFMDGRSTIVLAGTGMQLPTEVEHLSVRIALRLPSEKELKDSLLEVLNSLRGEKPFDIDLDPGGLGELIRALTGLTLKQARQLITFCITEDGRLSADDIPRIQERKAASIREQGLLEYYPTTLNQYALGGFRNLLAWLSQARVGFTDEARRLNLTPPKGILLVGVQGCGKSLAAKYVAREWKLPLLRLDAGRLFDKYVGESEKNLRKVVLQAESLAPVVLWIDEIEKGLSASGIDSSDGGLSRRVLGFFLTWLQEKSAAVFVVATANDLNAMPPELLRKGRFDEVFFVDLPDDDERVEILQIHLQLRKQIVDRFDMEVLVAATEGFSGAEIEQVVISGLYKALHERRILDTNLLIQAIQATVPLSVSRREQIESLRTWARNRFVGVR